MNCFDNLDLAMKNLIKRGAFLTAKGDLGVNTMTIAWGYIGFSWNKPYFVAMVRPQRYTYEVLKSAEDFTVSIPYSDNMKNALTICGTKSGRDINKEKEANISFISSNIVSSPVVKDCNMYYECKITYIDKIDKDKFPNELKKNYPLDDYHFLYYGEIVDCYQI